MKANELEAFHRFWSFVYDAELEVRWMGNIGSPPPDQVGDPWDDDFADAYETIKPFLSKFQRKRAFFPPPGVPLRPVPFEAETAHEALMFFLNKPDDLRGSARAMDSPEYLAIKQEAAEERRLRQAMREEAAKNRVRAAVMKKGTRSDLLLFISFLAAHHFPKGGTPVAEPLTQEQIMRGLNWKQPRVSRCFKRWFKSKKGMMVYRASCRSEDFVKKGFLKKYMDGDLTDLEAIDDVDNEIDNDDENEEE